MKTFSAKPEEVRRDWYVVDATDKVLGRLAAEVSRRLRGGILHKDGRKQAGMGVAGGTAGCNAILEQIPGGYTLIALSNYDPPSASKIGETVRGWMGMADGPEGKGKVVRRP